MLCNHFATILQTDRPAAFACIYGSSSNSNLCGNVHFYKVPCGGVIINANVRGLPYTDYSSVAYDNKATYDKASSEFYGFHIHERGDCTPPFDKTGNHYNPENILHPFHAGDLPPLLGINGYAWTSFYDNRFTISDIIGKSIVIHQMRDDFSTQPAGNSGTKIACGIIERANRF